MFTASAVPAAVGAALEAVRICRAEGATAVREAARQRRATCAAGFADLGLRVVEPGRLPDGSEATTPVVPVVVGEDWQAVLLWKALFDAGVYTNVALHPAVPPGGALLRTSLMATHEREPSRPGARDLSTEGPDLAGARSAEYHSPAMGSFALSTFGQAESRAGKACS